MFELSVILPVAAIVLFAAFTQGVVGFGFGMVSMGLLPLVLPGLFAIPLVAVFALAVATQITWHVRQHIDWRCVMPPLIGCLLGVLVGLAFLKEADPRYIKLTLGVFLVLFTSWSLLVKMKPRERPVSDGWGYFAGLVSGVLGGAFNCGGPPLVVYAAMKGWDKDITKSTLQVHFVLTGIVSVAGHMWAGRHTEDVTWMSLAMVPAIRLGVWLGGRLYQRIDQQTYRVALLLLLLVVGLVFIAEVAGAGPLPTPSLAVGAV